MVKIVAISDTHGSTPNLPEGDILIHSGDFSNWGTFLEFKAFITYLETKASSFKHIIVVPGNHDMWVESNVGLAKEELSNIGVNLIIDDYIEIEGIRFYGTPYTPRYGRWSFMDKEENLAERFRRIPENIDIFISHGPPFGYLDVNAVGENCGGHSLLKRIQEIKPSVVVFGHIHESKGSIISDIRYYNTANNPTTIEWTKKV